MRRPSIIPVMGICVCMVLCGCATTRYPKAYKVDDKEVGEFKELDDDKALKLVTFIYNVKSEAWEDGIARSIALQEYIGLLAKRKSAYIKNSGIFEITYDKVDIKKWKDDDLMKLYESLRPKAEPYYTESAPDLTESQNSQRILYLTALSSIEAELVNRDTKRDVGSVAGQVLMGVLSIALSML